MSSSSHRVLRHAVAAICVALSAAPHAAELTRDTGAPVGDNQNSQTAGPAGPVLLQDSALIEKLQRFDRERIPERVVHARGTGAFGEFVPSADISDLTKAKVFTPGTRTPVFVRFSTVMGYRGSPEQARDPRGFAVKFYTQQGNWDMVGINWPVFFIRDGIKFPDFVHANKPSAVTGVQDPNLAFDFFAHTPEATHMLTRLYTDEGMPDSYRRMDGFAVHAFKFVNAQGDVHYVKFHWKSQQGVHGLRPQEIPASIGRDWNMMTNDLYGALKQGDFPKWDLYVQVLAPKDLNRFDFDALDDTKVWTGVPEVQDRHDDAQPRARQLFPVDRGIGVRAVAARAGDRAVRRPDAAGSPVRIRRHADVPARRELHGSADQPPGRAGRQQQPGRQDECRRPQGRGELRTVDAE
ncbi:catalase family protein [Burkholderia cepacia]|uniref:Catalase n=1 Tax=Burkholderia cepacia TaxID=292 RepID=A0AA88YYL6_BURCE|nr:catalase family protein [Burkholderia cepacia]